MNKLIIINYIKKLTKNDISNYCLKNNIPLSNEELDIIYYYIKNRYNEFLNGKDIEILNEIKFKIKSATYNKMLELYNIYKNKI